MLVGCLGWRCVLLLLRARVCVVCVLRSLSLLFKTPFYTVINIDQVYDPCFHMRSQPSLVPAYSTGAPRARQVTGEEPLLPCHNKSAAAEKACSCETRGQR